ncbi:hypothetical protein GCM10023340_32990 [Nocardioides marinquilinus]|uniref:Uncharacterized protein n=1 Tax=Nocardioides marinquilinus TaxID=1210400 RepID=A0ABP9PW74_9ACTN
MLLPNKHSHPDQTVLAAAVTILKELRRKRVVTYDDLKASLDVRVRSADYLFSPAVSLLYLLELVEYRPTVDSFEYVGSE